MSDSGLFHYLGKVAYRKVSRVRISPPPQFERSEKVGGERANYFAREGDLKGFSLRTK